MLACAPAALFGLLLFLSRSMSVSGESVANRAFWFYPLPILRDFRAIVEEDVPDADYKLELNLYNAEGSLVKSASSGSTTSLNWTSSVITYYLRIRAVEFDTVNAPGDANNGLDVIRLAADATPTPTATPVPWNAGEINDAIDGAWPGGPCLLSVGMEVGNLSFIQVNGQPVPKPDYSTFLAKTGHSDRVTTIVGGANTEIGIPGICRLSRVSIFYDGRSVRRRIF